MFWDDASDCLLANSAASSSSIGQPGIRSVFPFHINGLFWLSSSLQWRFGLSLTHFRQVIPLSLAVGIGVYGSLVLLDIPPVGSGVYPLRHQTHPDGETEKN